MKTNHIPAMMPQRILLEMNFATNVNPLGPPEWVFEHLKENLLDITYYPELWHQNCDKRIADIWGFNPNAHLAISGTSQFFFSLSFLLDTQNKKTKWASCAPSFWEYSLVAKINNVNFCEFSIDLLEPDILVVENSFLAFIEKEKPDVLFVCTPNNPTGHEFSPNFVARIISLHPNMQIILDLTYAFFKHHFNDYLELFKYGKSKLIGVLSYSKFFCLPGLRVGSLFFSDPDLAEKAQKMMGPVRINSLAERILPLLLTDNDYIQTSRDFFIAEWLFFENVLIERNIDWLKSSLFGSCYRLFFIDFSQLDSEVTESLFVDKLYNDYGFRVCNAETYGIKNAIRIRVGTRKANLQLIDALHKCYNELLC